MRAALSQLLGWPLRQLWSLRIRPGTDAAFLLDPTPVAEIEALKSRLSGPTLA